MISYRHALDRRAFLGALGQSTAAAVLAGSLDPLRARAIAQELASHPGEPDELAGDEAFWLHAQQAFTVDRSLVNLNNGGVSPSPAVVQQAMQRHLEFSNAAPAHNMWHVLEPRRETVRQGLSSVFGCDPEEIAITRNASEGLEICQLGLELKAGDEVLTTNQDYPRMLATFRQRERRDGIVLRTFSIPVPCEDPREIIARFEQNITAKTRLILMCHVVNLTGQVLPVREVVQLARRRGIPVIVDGAHAFAHFPFAHDELDCDFYATSLHKWLCAPHGTGMLYVRRDRIAGLWPMMAAPEAMDHDIRKFEEIGTHPAANTLAIAEALAFHEGLGPQRKAARLCSLRDRWAHRLLQHDRVRLNTSLRPGLAYGVANFRVEGMDSGALSDWMWSRHRILTVTIKHEDFEGIRVTPHVYTTLSELDRFCDTVESALRDGLPRS
jgi:selenocysteine lyase/cysteine desulfurase